MNQLKALIDLCHIHGLAVLLDVVYNHAGGDFGDESLYFFDRQPTAGGNRNSLYFTDKGHAGGLVFDFGKPEVRDFLIQNAKFFLDEYRVDGFRYDQVSVIDHDGAPHGWRFCQDLTVDAAPPSAGRAGQGRVLERQSVRREGAAGRRGLRHHAHRRPAHRHSRRHRQRQRSPDERPLDMTGLARSLWPDGFAEHWRFVQGPENHDIVYQGREQRVARLGDPDNPRSWFGRSRARVATGISLTAPGIPMLFMGQEFLEDKQWSDNFEVHADLLLHWAGLDAGRQADARSRAVHARADRAALALSRPARPGLPRRARPRSEPRARLPPLGRGRRARRDRRRAPRRRSTASAIASASPAAASGAKSSTATSTRTGSIRTSSAMAAASSPSRSRCTASATPRRSCCRPTACWCLRAEAGPGMPEDVLEQPREARIPAVPPARGARVRHHHLPANDGTVHWGYFSKSLPRRSSR